MHVPLLDLTIQNAKIKNLAQEKFSEVFDSSAFILGKEVDTFEKNIAGYLSIEHAIGTSSGNDAILLALMALDVKPGDEVICPSFTFFSTASCPYRLGARPVFVDINVDDFNMSISDLRKKITKKTKAIIPVHLFGQTSDITSVVEIANEHGISVIEDCAQSLGAKHMGGQSGTFGDIGCFSFYPTKNLGGFGDAGLVCTKNPLLAERLRLLRVHGAQQQYFHKYIGGNFRIDELQAALLNLKLPHLDTYINNRRKNAEFYLEGLKDITEIILPREKEGNFHTWNQFTIRVLNGGRDELKNFLKQKDIGCNIYYPLPLDSQECFQHIVDRKNFTVNAAKVSNEVVSLPIFPELTTEQLQYVVDNIKNFFA